MSIGFGITRAMTPATRCRYFQSEPIVYAGSKTTNN